jgi:hypothetical protein
VIRALLGDKIVVNRVKVFKPKTTGVGNGSLRVDFCREKVFKAKTSGTGDDPLSLGVGLCTFGFNISWSVISFFWLVFFNVFDVN